MPRNGFFSARARLTKQRQVVIALHRNAGINHVMANTLIAQEHLETVMDERQQVMCEVSGKGERFSSVSHVHRQSFTVKVPSIANCAHGGPDALGHA